MISQDIYLEKLITTQGTVRSRMAYQFIGRANMNLFLGRRNQIEFFVRFKAHRSLKCVQYDPYLYHVVYQ